MRGCEAGVMAMAKEFGSKLSPYPKTIGPEKEDSRSLSSVLFTIACKPESALLLRAGLPVIGPIRRVIQEPERPSRLERVFNGSPNQSPPQRTLRPESASDVECVLVEQKTSLQGLRLATSTSMSERTMFEPSE